MVIGAAGGPSAVQEASAFASRERLE